MNQPADEGGASGGNHRDATADEASSGGDDVDATTGSDDASGDDLGDDGGDDAAPASACPSGCGAGQQCCTKTGNLLYGKCYSALTCPICC